MVLIILKMICSNFIYQYLIGPTCIVVKSDYTTLYYYGKEDSDYWKMDRTEEKLNERAKDECI